VFIFGKYIGHGFLTIVGYKENVGGAAAVLLAAAALTTAPRPLGHLALLAALPLFRRWVVWTRFESSFVASAAVAYLGAFLLDFFFVGIPHETPPWWQVVVLAPLAEELVFRALAFAFLPPPLAWIFAVVIFGALHPANPLVASLYGASLAFMYRGGGYVAAVALHAFNNALWLALATGLL
jgi:membrane protease YdiL (CAAX protease family)